MSSKYQNSQYSSQNASAYRASDRSDRTSGSSMRDRDQDSSYRSSRDSDDDYLNQDRPYRSSVREQNQRDFRDDRYTMNETSASPRPQFNDQDRGHQNWNYGRGQGSSYRPDISAGRYEENYSSRPESRDNQRQQGRYGQQLGPSYGSTSSDGQDFGRPGFSANVNNNRTNTDWESRLAFSAPDYSRTNRDFEGYGNGLNSSSSRSWSPGATQGQVGKYSGVGPKNYKRSDDRIKEEINENLTRHYEIDASDVEIEVKDGEVTITGMVPERRMKHMVEDLIDQSMGVKDVINQLRVKKDLGQDSDDSSISSSTSTNKSSKKSNFQNTPH